MVHRQTSVLDGTGSYFGLRTRSYSAKLGVIMRIIENRTTLPSASPLLGAGIRTDVPCSHDGCQNEPFKELELERMSQVAATRGAAFQNCQPHVEGGPSLPELPTVCMSVYNPKTEQFRRFRRTPLTRESAHVRIYWQKSRISVKGGML